MSRPVIRLSEVCEMIEESQRQWAFQKIWTWEGYESCCVW